MRPLHLLNELGAIILVLAGAVLLFSIFLSLLGLPLRTERNLIRILLLELIDKALARRGRSSIAAKTARIILKGWLPIKFFLLRFSGLGTQGMAIQLSRHALFVHSLLVSIAFLVLLSLMWTTNLKNVLVVNNSAVDLPLFFRLTGAWAGSSGSLLFWYFLLALFTAIIVYQTKNRLFNRQPVLLLILGMMNILFVFLNLFFEDAQPFRVFNNTMQSGRGLNPLLQHWAMIIHPPVLYLGYVSFAIPCAIAMAAVISGNLREDWLKLIRRWSLFSWFFLGIGILLGSKWAYEELGWGGYWAWDPVENASLMPFLLATAFLHSLIVQERRGMLRFWNILLITLTYHFCLLGTWITRSGVLQGPHSFAESTIGKPFIIYIILSLLFFLRYLYFSRQKLRPKRNLENVTSKEGSMLLNNFLMLLATLIILIGVFSPIFRLDCSFGIEGFSCQRVEWKLSTYNKIMVPIGIMTLFLMGASPLLTWRRSADQVYAKNLRLPLIAGIIACIVFAITYGYFFTRASGIDESSWGPGIVAEIFSILTIGISFFVVVGLSQEFYRGLTSRRQRFKENIFLSVTRLILRNKRRYGGYLLHLAIVFLFIGFSGNAFKKTEKFEFQYYKMAGSAGSDVIHYSSQDKAYLDNYEIEARDLFLRPIFKPNADRTNPVHLTISQEAHFYIRHGNTRYKFIQKPKEMSTYDFANRPPSRFSLWLKFWTGYILDGRLKTERQFHPQIHPVSGRLMRDNNGVTMRTPTSEPDIRSTWSEDIYIQLGTILDPTTNRNPDLNHRYETYFYRAQKHPRAYLGLFPNSLIATLEVWINPLVKFIWLGSILFFLGGLILLIPYGERMG